MQAIILAGGMGTRLRPLTYTNPKPMLPVANRPALAHIIEALAKANCSSVIVTTNYLANVVEEGLRDEGFTIPITFVQEEQPLGTAGCVRNCLHLLDEEFIVIQGDAVAEVNYEHLIRFHHDHDADVTMSVMKVDDPREFGIVDVDQEGRIQRFQEKPLAEEAFSDLANAGFYVLKRQFFDRIPEGEQFDFSKQLFPALMAENARFFAYQLRGYWVDIGRITTYLEGNQYAIKGCATVAADVKIPESSTLVPPFLIGKGTKIGDRCVIGPGTIIGNSCTIGHGSQISGSVLYRDVTVGMGARLNDCVVASRCRLGNGVNVGPRATIGQGCEIGAGVQVGPHSRVGPLVPVAAGTVVEGLVSPRIEKLDTLQRGIIHAPIFDELSTEQRAVYALLSEFGEMTARELSEATSIGPGRLLGVLNTMEARGVLLATLDIPHRYALTREESRTSRRLLFVDDLPDTREFIRLAFSMQGHSTRVAKSGAEALAAVAEEEFDAIIMDVEMPVMDGWDAVRGIRKLDHGKDVPIIMFTAYGDDDEVASMATEVGANSVLRKPLLPNDVLAHVLKYLKV